MILPIILGVFLAISLYINFNLMKKEEKLEDVVAADKKFISMIRQDIHDMNERLQQIDEKGTFQSDDEIGWFFENIKEIQTQLNQYDRI